MKKTLKDIINEEYQKLLVKNKNKPLSEGLYGDNLPDDYDPRKDPYQQDDDEEDEEELSREELWDQHEEATNKFIEDVESKLVPFHPNRGEWWVNHHQIINNDIPEIYDLWEKDKTGQYKNPAKIAEYLRKRDEETVAEYPNETMGTNYEEYAEKLIPFIEEHGRIQDLFRDYVEKDIEEKGRRSRWYEPKKQIKESKKPLAESVNKRLLKLAGIK